MLKYNVHEPAYCQCWWLRSKQIHWILSFRCKSTFFSWETAVALLHQFHLSTLWTPSIVSWLHFMIVYYHGKPVNLLGAHYQSEPVVFCHPKILSTDLLGRQHQMLPLSHELLFLDVASGRVVPILCSEQAGIDLGPVHWLRVLRSRLHNGHWLLSGLCNIRIYNVR